MSDLLKKEELEFKTWGTGINFSGKMRDLKSSSVKVVV